MTFTDRPIGIIGAMDDEVFGLIAHLENHKTESVCGIEFHTGSLFCRNVVIAKCGVGKVFASMCVTAMAIKYSPALIINTGVGGALSTELACTDIVIADKLVQYDMDTSAIGDPVGLISGINKVYFDADARAGEILSNAADELGIHAITGTIATGDRFVSDTETREKILKSFPDSVCCEMEGGAIAHASYVAGIPFAVVRAISDGANGDAPLDFPAFLKIAVKSSEALTLALVERY